MVQSAGLCGGGPARGDAQWHFLVVSGKADHNRFIAYRSTVSPCTLRECVNASGVCSRHLPSPRIMHPGRA